jgi:hypothetical protein
LRNESLSRTWKGSASDWRVRSRGVAFFWGFAVAECGLIFLVAADRVGAGDIVEDGMGIALAVGALRPCRRRAESERDHLTVFSPVELGVSKMNPARARACVTAAATLDLTESYW